VTDAEPAGAGISTATTGEAQQKLSVPNLGEQVQRFHSSIHFAPATRRAACCMT
jgi:hypothetical protein